MKESTVDIRDELTDRRRHRARYRLNNLVKSQLIDIIPAIKQRVQLAQHEGIAPLLSAGKSTLVGIMTHDNARCRRADRATQPFALTRRQKNGNPKVPVFHHDTTQPISQSL